MADKITDQYGNKIGTVEQNWTGGQTVRDNFGVKVATTEKAFLSDDQIVRDPSGNEVARVKKDFLGKGSSIYNKSGQRVGGVTSVSGNEGGTTVLLFVLVGLGLALALGFKSVPANLRAAFTTFEMDDEFGFGVFPIFIMLLIDIISLIIRKGPFDPERGGFGYAMFVQVLIGLGCYIGWIVLTTVFWMFTGESFWECLFGMILMPFYYIATYLVMLIPTALVFSIISVVRKR